MSNNYKSCLYNYLCFKEKKQLLGIIMYTEITILCPVKLPPILYTCSTQALLFSFLNPIKKTKNIVNVKFASRILYLLFIIAIDKTYDVNESYKMH